MLSYNLSIYRSAKIGRLWGLTHEEKPVDCVSSHASVLMKFLTLSLVAPKVCYSKNLTYTGTLHMDLCHAPGDQQLDFERWCSSAVPRYRVPLHLVGVQPPPWHTHPAPGCTAHTSVCTKAEIQNLYAGNRGVRQCDSAGFLL